MGTTSSTPIANAEANPRVLNNPAVTKGRRRGCHGVAAVAAADTDGWIYRIARVPSNAVMARILRRNTAITSGTDFDVGVYRTSDDGGAVVDVNFFADAVDLSSASLTGVDDLVETGSNTAADLTLLAKPLWQALGLTEDPNISYDICYTGVTVGSAAGVIAALVEWDE